MQREHPLIPKISCDHFCQISRRFDTKKQAAAASQAIFLRTGKLRQAETCRHCSGYHLADAK